MLRETPFFAVALVASALLATTTPVYAEGIEGIYRDGEGKVEVRQDGDGYRVTKTVIRNGKESILTGRGKVKNGRLVVDLGSSSATSAKARMGILSGQQSGPDIKLRTFVLRTAEAATRRIAPLPGGGGQTQASEDSSLVPSESPVGDATTAPELKDRRLNSATTQGEDGGDLQADHPAENSPFLAGVAAVAAAAAAAGAGATAAAGKGSQRGETSSAGGSPEALGGSAGSLNSQVPAAAELAALAEIEAVLQDDGSYELPAPKLFDEAGLRKLTGNTGQLGDAERAILEYTNMQILQGGTNTDLGRNLDQAARYRQPQLTAADARALDGARGLLSPIEQEVLDYTNKQRQIGGPNSDLAANYRRYLEIYQQRYAGDDATSIYKAIEGFGTNEEAVVAALAGKSRGQIRILEEAFRRKLLAEGESTSRGSSRSALENWIVSDLSGGWEEKALDGLNSRRIKDDTEYFWSSSAAKAWNEFLQESDRGAKNMIAHGNLLEQGVGYLNQGLFAGAGAVNNEVEYAQKYYMDVIEHSDNGVVKFAAKTGYVFASLGGSFGTKALDPSLDYHQTEEGLFDLALLVGTFGAGKLVQAGAKTATGARVLGRVSKAMQQLSRLSYSLKRVTGLAGSTRRLNKAGQSFRALAEATKDSTRATRALAAAERYEEAGRRAVRVEQALERARKAEEAARAALRTTSSAEEAARLAEEALRLARTAEKEVEALRLAERSARLAGREASLLNNNALARGYDATRNALGSEFRTSARKLRDFSSKIDDGVSARVADDMRAIASRNLAGASGDMTGAQFNAVYDDLVKYAEKRGISVKTTMESKGVYPSGLSEIRTAQFGRYSDVNKLVSAGDRHELAHMFHMIQMRATMIGSLGQGGRLTAAATAEANAALKIMESNGATYRQLEKAVTRLSNPSIHRAGRTYSDVGRYANRVDDLVEHTRNGMNVGKISFPNGAALEDVYALIVSKAPLAVGTGIKDMLLTRMPALIFGTYYIDNMSLSSIPGVTINPAAWGIEGSPSMGLRDFTNALIAQGYHPPVKP